ncbi:ABC transporter permease [Aestuariivirga sp.]|uniref:ABC transporter permease n=1 Tax=Aestuariivirga sp. TaxID=2650926 RepID=UPI003BAD4C76
MPTIIFIAAVFIFPVGRFLILSIDNSDFTNALPRTSQIAGLRALDGVGTEAAFAALVQDLAEATATRKDALLAQSLNQRLVGTRALVLKTAKDAAAGNFAAPFRESVLAKHQGWAKPEIWKVLDDNRSPFTDFNILASYDLKRQPDGRIGAAPAQEAIFVGVLTRTIVISAVVTLLCAVLSVPLAQAIVSSSPLVSRMLFALVLFPLWSSLLVRTIIWIIVLQKTGPVNAAIVFLGITDGPMTLIYTRFSLYLAMVQVLLPLMILSVVSIMRRVSPSYMKAALSLGAPWLTAWRTVQLPLILPGIMSGAAIVFVFALGYYVTPALVGGPRDQMISSMIAFYTNKTLNWGLAAALSLQLLVVLIVIAALFWTVQSLFRRKVAS